MTSEREQLLALRTDAEAQWQRFGGAGPFLFWWDDEQCLPDRDAPNSFNPLSQHARRIGQLVYPHHTSSSSIETTTVGTVFIDPADKAPKAAGAFRELANRIGCLLESRHPELKSLIVETYPAVVSKDWTLAWIFKQQFTESADALVWGVTVPDVFGCLIACIDDALATLSCRSSSPRGSVLNWSGSPTWSVDVPYSDSGQTGCPDGPLKPDGFCLNGVNVGGLAENWLKVLTFVWEHRDNPPKLADVMAIVHEPNRDAFDKLLDRIRTKLKKAKWPETLEVFNGCLMLREPVRPPKAKSNRR